MNAEFTVRGVLLLRLCIGFACCFLLVANTTLYAEDQDRGTLRGRFVYDGEPPKPKMIKISKDVGICGKEIVDESLLVNPENRGIANVVVWLFAKEPPKHPRSEELLREPAVLTMLGCRFEPHIQVVTTGQQLTFENKDLVGHSVKYDVLRNKLNDALWPANSTVTKKFTHAEIHPVQTTCVIHPWMKAYLTIFDHSYVAVSDADGKFEIPELPSGKWTFRVWQERSGYITKVTRDERIDEWPHGRFTATIAPDEGSLGEILVPASTFDE